MPQTAKQKRTQRERRVSEGLCPKCGREPKPGYVVCALCSQQRLDEYHANPERWLARNKAYVERLRAAAYSAYGGPTCSCCGEAHREFLTFDHVGGGGKAHRQRIGRGAYALYLWLKRNNYPPGFRVLCINCNFSIGVHGYCPHAKERDMAMTKVGVECGGPSKPVPAGTKQATEGCDVCGAKHPLEGAETSSGPSSTTKPSAPDSKGPKTTR